MECFWWMRGPGCGAAWTFGLTRRAYCCGGHAQDFSITGSGFTTRGGGCGKSTAGTFRIRLASSDMSSQACSAETTTSCIASSISSFVASELKRLWHFRKPCMVCSLALAMSPSPSTSSSLLRSRARNWCPLAPRCRGPDLPIFMQSICSLQSLRSSFSSCRRALSPLVTTSMTLVSCRSLSLSWTHCSMCCAVAASQFTWVTKCSLTASL
mmetsp:Transcript_3873/g.9150  ORF Transcript_3873/g.9150 Transcript_3873/m.9150 type:complete len:211 (+) Transcript_3873:493-1125(+)